MTRNREHNNSERLSRELALTRINSIWHRMSRKSFHCPVCGLNREVWTKTGANCRTSPRADAGRNVDREGRGHSRVDLRGSPYLTLPRGRVDEQKATERPSKSSLPLHTEPVQGESIIASPRARPFVGTSSVTSTRSKTFSRSMLLPRVWLDGQVSSSNVEGGCSKRALRPSVGFTRWKCSLLALKIQFAERDE